MLIQNDKQKEVASMMIPGQICGHCTSELTYPIIIGTDRNATAYHASCAMKFATGIMTDIGDLVRDLQETQTMAAAFREAALQRKEQ